MDDDLASIVIDCITPKHLSWDEIIEAGSGEFVAMLSPEDYHVAYMHLMGDNEVELARVVLELDGGRTISENDIKEYEAHRFDNAFAKAVYANDFKAARDAIRYGARNFHAADTFLSVRCGGMISSNLFNLIEWHKAATEDEIRDAMNLSDSTWDD
jgi:hypothetical protein